MNHTVFAGIQLAVMVSDLIVPVCIIYIFFIAVGSIFVYPVYPGGVLGFIFTALIVLFLLPLSIFGFASQKDSFVAWKKENIKKFYKVICE